MIRVVLCGCRDELKRHYNLGQYWLQLARVRDLGLIRVVLCGCRDELKRHYNLGQLCCVVVGMS